MKEFFAAVEIGGATRPVKTPELVQVNYRTFEKDHLEQAKEQARREKALHVDTPSASGGPGKGAGKAQDKQDDPQTGDAGGEWMDADVEIWKE